MTRRNRQDRIEVRGPDGKKQFYRPLVFLITSRDALGRPREFRALYDEESIELKGGEDFMIAFAPDAVTAKTRS